MRSVVGLDRGPNAQDSAPPRQDCRQASFSSGVKTNAREPVMASWSAGSDAREPVMGSWGAGAVSGSVAGLVAGLGGWVVVIGSGWGKGAQGNEADQP